VSRVNPVFSLFGTALGELSTARLYRMRYHGRSPMRRKDDENALVGRIARPFQSEQKRSLSVAIGDDAALWAPVKGQGTILTCDWFLEGSHFVRARHPADAVGWKCLARAVSDIAAMGGRPRCFLLSLALPSVLSGKWLDGFLGGLRRASRELDCALAGGDTTRHDKVLINVTAVGEVRNGHAVRRSGARPGDILFVSGALGEAEVGLRQLRSMRGRARAANAALRKHLYPRPRLELGQWLAENSLATAMMDLSDGLSSDLPRLCSASRVGARIEASSLPVSRAAKGEEAVELALHGGDDYELLFAVRPVNLRRVPRWVRGVALTRIGQITRERKIILVQEGKKRRLMSAGWDPFRRV
jgi:thiamine-monophosphate kinase